MVDDDEMLIVSGGSLSPCGFMFERVGSVVIQTEKTLDEIMDIAIDIGASDVLQHDEVYEIITEPADLNAVAQRVKDTGLEILEAELKHRPQEVLDGVSQEVHDLIEQLENDPDVVKVTTNTNA